MSYIIVAVAVVVIITTGIKIVISLFSFMTVLIIDISRREIYVELISKEVTA